MRVRTDSVFVSSVLHTIALVSLVPTALWNYYSGSHKEILARLDAGFQAYAQTAHYLGVASLAIIIIGLIVIWTGYVSRNRSAWFVMAVIAWVWVFPLFVLPFVKGTWRLTFSEWVYSAMLQSGLPRIAAESFLIFLVMIIALLLPIRSFISPMKMLETQVIDLHRRSAASSQRSLCSLVSHFLLGYESVLSMLFPLTC